MKHCLPSIVIVTLLLPAAVVRCTAHQQAPEGDDAATDAGLGDVVAMPDAAICIPLDSSCGQCEYAHCCEALAECTYDPECVALRRCQAACSLDASCLEYTYCTTEHPEGQTKVDDAVNCLKQNCKTVCGY